MIVNESSKLITYSSTVTYANPVIYANAPFAFNTRRSHLLRFTINQYKLLIDDPLYVKDTSYWHRIIDGKVHSSFAGSYVRYVMGPQWNCTPESLFEFNVEGKLVHQWVHQLYNLYCMRIGNLRAAFNIWKDDVFRKYVGQDYYDIDISLEDSSPSLMEQLNELADWLEAKDL